MPKLNVVVIEASVGGLDAFEKLVSQLPAVLMQLKEGSLIRFRCYTGHAYSLNTLLAEVTQSIEETLWDGIRAIEASEMLMTHTAKHLREVNEHEAADLLLQKAEAAKRRADLVQQAVMNQILSEDNLEEEVKLSEGV